MQKQFDFLESHRDVALVGTWAQIYVGDEPSQRLEHGCTGHGHRQRCQRLTHPALVGLAHAQGG
jgi:hypothetical protein